MDIKPEGIYLRWENDGRVLIIERIGGDGSVNTLALARNPEVETLLRFLGAK